MIGFHLTLKGGTLFDEDWETACCAKFFIFSRTTLIPLSSEAFSSKILDFQTSPKRSLEAANIVLVLPVPVISQSRQSLQVSDIYYLLNKKNSRNGILPGGP